MPFSPYLDSQRENCRALVAALREKFEYVSVLGSDVRATVYRADRKSSLARDGEGECGFVIKMQNGGAFYEYALDDISGDKKELAARIAEAVALDRSLEKKTIAVGGIADEPLRKDYVRETDLDECDDKTLLDYCKKLSSALLAKDEKVVNAIAMLQPILISKLFVTENRELSQHYGWCTGMLVAIYADDGRMAENYEFEGSDRLSEVTALLEKDVDHTYEYVKKLAAAEQIKPGVYDVITDPSITGLIAHEAFGHGVEMDQFVKDRALAKKFVGKYVASPITDMHDGAAAAHSVASYFFDDDGVPAHDTQIIDKGILIAGLSDLASAAQLGTAPTGNGRRESFKRKAYSRMTNTFFSPGKDKLEDMIASIEHGYMLFQTDNGMEDPKNWQIQCAARYGIEIENGKLTDRFVSPVVMTGSVPELLKSISMISDEFKIDGAGFCGKGYKEWVRVSDGGPHLKVRVKLG